jgi:hypothetical protein
LLQIGLVKHDKPKELYLKVFEGGADQGQLLEIPESEGGQLRPLEPKGFIAA